MTVEMDVNPMCELESLGHAGIWRLARRKNVVGRRLAVLQSNYIPWKGYFDLINAADIFILYDTAQFTKNDWRNRNRIKTCQGPIWLTIPVTHRFGQSIAETVVVGDRRWASRHWTALAQVYARAAHFADYKDWLGELYREVAQEPD